jgi:hypothetical protein
MLHKQERPMPGRAGQNRQRDGKIDKSLKRDKVIVKTGIWRMPCSRNAGL